ncbi:MAG: glutamine synthetase [Rhodospirillaceae bacterium]|nr:glutamine synthetase [Rhodospirillaceae bacterium]
MPVPQPRSTPAHRGFPGLSDALVEWLDGRQIEEVECVVPDIVGIARGKAMPTGKYVQLTPTYLPVSIFFQTITGEYAYIEREEYWTEIDLRLVPDIDTARAVPWASDVTVQVIHDLNWLDGRPVPFAPRNVLKRVLELYTAEGWRPVVAPELEFYLTKRNTDADYPVEPPIGRTGRQGVGRQAYSISSVDEYEPIIEDIYDFLTAQGLEIDTIIQEGGAGQIEINLNHGDPLELADQVFVFKRTIREAALRNDCYATFMAKPMANEPGSAMHLHQSVVDINTGRNLFSNDDGEVSDLFHGFLAGHQNHIASVACLLAPYVNSYRRLVPGSSAPVNLEWGWDNRSVGLRIPNSDPPARRVENRVVGADANPYLAIAACLACGYLGMKAGLAPRPALTGNAYSSSQNPLPESLEEALRLFSADRPVREVLGPEFCDLFGTVKRYEMLEFRQVISPWEREHLLLNV